MENRQQMFLNLIVIIINNIKQACYIWAGRS